MKSSRSERSTRAPTPVEVVYYPKKARNVSRRRQTVETVVTEIVAESTPEKGRRARTLTDETVDPGEQAFADLTRVGHEAFEAGRTEEARVIFESLVALGQSHPFAHTMLGTIHLGAHRIDAALAQFEAALAIDPDDLAALVYRGEIRLTKRKWVGAMDDLERAVKLGRAQDPFVLRARKLLPLARANRTS